MDSNSTWSSAGRGVIRGSFDLAPVQHFSSPKASNHHFSSPSSRLHHWQNHHHHYTVYGFGGSGRYSKAV